MNTDLTIPDFLDTSKRLTVIVDRAAKTLASATNAAQVLEASEKIDAAYDEIKRQTRLAKAKGAHDEIIAKAHRAQADILELEAQAKRRLADEYDAAQERGEVRGDRERTASSPEAVSASDIGLTHKQVHEAREIRNAEVAQPGIVKATVDAAIAAGEEPTRAKVKQAVRRVMEREKFGSAPPSQRPGRGRAAICARAREAISILAGLPPASEVVAFLAGTDDAVLVGEQLPAAARWLSEFNDLWPEEAMNAEAAE